MPRSLLLILLIFPVTGHANQTVQFHYDPNDGGGALTCNGKQMGKPPIDCNYDASEKLRIERANWGGEALLKKDGPITGDCAKSLIGGNNSYNLTPNCLPGSRNTGNNTSTIKKATGAVILDEWYTDLPWNQKLSTKDSNLIKAPFVLPYAALDPSLCRATTQVEKSRCMLQYGIVNVMAMHRTDTLYNPGEAPKDQDCHDNNCVEVKIRIQRLHTLTANPQGYDADIVRNDRYTHNSPGLNGAVPSLGFAVSEATIFAPWRPWYMGHYCAKDADNKADAVCYEDYFTTQLQALATTANNEVWLKDNPGVMDPHGTEPTFLPFCKKGFDYCDMYLGKVDWVKNATAPLISECGSDPKTCMKEVNDKTRDLDIQFNKATDEYVDVGRYPWDDEPYFSGSPEEEIRLNPFIGYYELKKYSDNAGGTPKAPFFKATHYVLPKECTKDTYLGARYGDIVDIEDLEKCVLNFEIHTTGFHEQWKWLWGGKRTAIDIDDISRALQGTDANQYGRTMFIYAGVPEQHIPVSFRTLKDGMSVYDKMYNASIYIQYLPMVNPADMTLKTKYYTDDFWHAILMSNHMNQTPDHFIRGIRGRTLWHNEYRSDILYKSATTEKKNTKNTAFENILNHVDFPAGFQEKNSTSPYHGNTCDSCHVRNGSGVPLMPNGKLPEIHVKRGMKHDYKLTLDYTYSNSDHKGREPTQVLPSMKIVFIDLNDTSDSSVSCDDNNNSVPKYSPFTGGEYPPDRYYTNKIMNFYGNSLHVNQKGDLPTYDMEYVVITDNDGFEVVDKTVRGKIQPVQKGGDFPYLPRRIKIGNINVGTTCKNIASKPHNVDNDTWPATCNDVSGNSIEKAIETNKIGYIHLLGRRLGNTPMIEMIPDKTIQETQRAQASGKMQYSGCISLAPGTRRGSNDNEFNYRSCTSGNYGTGDTDCYIGRWGWIGDRASLEDQIANAASVEMNITSGDSYTRVHPRASDPDQLVRYNQTLCGPADATCKTSHANSDITEHEIRDMATYQRWIGIPNRSEYQVTSEKVQAGEQIFRDLQCNSCHVIDKIAFEVNDNMLPDEERKHLETLQIEVRGKNDYPFISYLGTDLLLHDMGYLSQVAKAPAGVKIRDEHTGEVKQEYRNYVQRIRTPALKSLRFNRFVTDSNHNTKDPLKKGNSHYIPGCDFLLHDGRACDAIEATYLHDGPAIKELGTIKSLNELSATQLEQLRAFLYSL